MINLKNVFKISDSRFFGIDFDINGNFLFLVPKQLYPNNDDPLYQIKLLKMCFEILSSYVHSKEKNMLLKYNNSIESSLNIFNGMVQLINDYIEYGDFFIYNSCYKKGDKKINWLKTIEDKDVFIQNNIVIYNSHISKTKEKNFDSEFYMLYKYALNKSLNIFKDKNNFENKLNFSAGKIKSIISNFQDKSFKDRDQKIVRALKNIFINSNFSINHDESFMTPYHEKFEQIWEFMIESIIPNKMKLNGENSFFDNFNGQYIDINGNKICNGSSFKYDHLIVDKNNIHILDSKFYNFYNVRDSKNSPSTDNISKQENYKNIISTVYKNHNIYNYFIFPKNNKSNKEPEFFAIHKSKKSDLFTIKCIAVDVETVIKYYLSKVSYKDLIDEIKKNSIYH